jgi:transcriptional regulator with XRE-family HTH domain
MKNTKSKIKIQRKLHNLTQNELGDKMGVGKTTISNWETGYSSPDTDSMFRLSKIFGCSMEYLASEDENDKGDAKFINNVTINKVRDLAHELGITGIEVLEKIVSEGYSLDDLYDALKLIESVQSKKKE